MRVYGWGVSSQIIIERRLNVFLKGRKETIDDLLVPKSEKLLAPRLGLGELLLLLVRRPAGRVLEVVRVLRVAEVVVRLEAGGDDGDEGEAESSSPEREDGEPVKRMERASIRGRSLREVRGKVRTRRLGWLPA